MRRNKLRLMIKKIKIKPDIVTQEIANANIPTKTKSNGIVTDVAKHLRQLIDKHGKDLSKKKKLLLEISINQRIFPN